MRKKNISLIIPVFREEKRIYRCIEETLRYLNNAKNIGKYEIIFVADKSGDKTISLIKGELYRDKNIRLIVNRKRLQKGGSVKIGMLSGKYEILLFFDADISTPLYEIDTFLRDIDRFDILIASRGLEESNVEKKWFKIFLSMCFSLIKKIVLGINFKDTQCGFKMFKKHCKILFKKQTLLSGFFDVEILLLAKKLKFKVKELPITWIDADMSNYNTFDLVVQAIKDVAMIKINDLKGIYDAKKPL